MDSSLNEEDHQNWTCVSCTYLNPSHAFKCKMCNCFSGTSSRKSSLNTEAVKRVQEELTRKVVKQKKSSSLKRKLANSSTQSFPLEGMVTLTNSKQSLPAKNDSPQTVSPSKTPKNVLKTIKIKSKKKKSNEIAATFKKNESSFLPAFNASFQHLDRSKPIITYVTCNGFCVKIIEFQALTNDTSTHNGNC